MDEQELDDWFIQERDKLEEEFFAAKHNTDNAREHFDKKYKQLVHDLQHKQNALYTHQLRAAALQRPITRWQGHWRLGMEQTGMWFAARKEQWRKWWFDRKIKRILRKH